jgi:hypothetical protein
MNFKEFSNVVKFEGLTPKTHDFYVANFSYAIWHQKFLDHAYKNIADLKNVWFRISGNSVYFIVDKNTIIPENFASSLTKIEHSPEDTEDTEELSEGQGE